MSCPICKLSVNRSERFLSGYHGIDCRRCGKYFISDTLYEGDLESTYLKSIQDQVKLSHYSRTQNLYGQEAKFTSYLVEDLRSADSQSVHEQIENFILFVGESTHFIGLHVPVSPEYDFTIIGADTAEGIRYIAKHLLSKELITLPPDVVIAIDPIHIILTVEGWEYYESLKKGKSRSNKCFMAMQFNNTYVENLYRNHIKEAMSELGFSIKLLTEDQPAGLIDDQLKVDINSSKFLIADVTDDNKNVYWEAGYAEGQGKPVVYICKSAKFNSSAPFPFDTNHRLHVLWEEGKENEFIKKLKSTIQATFPGVVATS